MKLNWYKFLLVFLRGLIYAKRAVFWFFDFLWRGIIKLNNVYKVTLGLTLYKFIFHSQKYLHNLKFSREESKLEFFGRRGTLQIVLFLVVFFVMVPHSKLYSQQYEDIAGRQTLLYSIVGSGDQDFNFEEITQAINQLPQTGETWDQGSVSALEESGGKAPQDLASISAGGSAINKPIIMPGVDISELTDTSPSTRSQVVYYEVQSGDVIGSIAEKFGISVNTILWANGLTLRSYIRPGDSLKILPASGVLHKVVSGDTVLKLASKYDVDAKDIISYNKLQKNGADIVVGEDLIIPGGVKAQPTRQSTYIVSRPASFDQVVAPPPSVSAPAGSGYLWPTAVQVITQYFGWRHTGLDIAGPIGTPIYATKSGTVLKSQCGWNWGYGCYVHIDHGNGIQTIYAHASALYVQVGQTVSQGQTIAAIGSTGNSTGPHLHFEIRIGGRAQNPLAYIRK